MFRKNLGFGGVLLAVGLSWSCNADLAGNSGDGDGNGNGNGGSPGAKDPGKQPVELPGGLKLQGRPSYYRVIRVTHSQWEASVRDVLQLTALSGLSTGFIPDPPNGKFSNNEHALYVTDSLRLDYQRSAEAVAESVSRDSNALARLGATPEAVIQAVGKRAFRRDLEADELATYQALWDQGAGYFESGDAFADGAQIFIEAILQSPHFLYRVELAPSQGRLTGLELATKLSFLLRNTTPNDQLLAAAQAGELDSDAGLTAVATAMLEEEAARNGLGRFHNELLGLDRYNSILKSTEAFPNYREEMNQVLLDADLMFFSRIYNEGFGIREILTSNVAFVDELTAPLYGLTASGPELTQVELDGSRPGFLTRVGFLAYNATLIHPDPIHRGVDINNRLMCAHLEPPLGEIPPLPTPIPGQTNRERVAAHTEVGVCKNCHGTVINPPGFALETFDALGQIRTTDNEKPIDTSGTFSALDTDQSFTNIVELTDRMASSLKAHGCYAANLAEFALSRDVGATDVDMIEGLQNASHETDLSLKELLLTLIVSPRFTQAPGAQ